MLLKLLLFPFRAVRSMSLALTMLCSLSSPPIFADSERRIQLLLQTPIDPHPTVRPPNSIASSCFGGISFWRQEFKLQCSNSNAKRE